MKKPGATGTLPGLSRRQFLKASGMAALLANLPAGWAGRVFAADAPETPRLRIGIIALTDCSSIVIAYEKGFFKEHGLEVTGRRGHVHDGTLDRSRGAGVVEEPELLNTADVIVFVATTNAERARAFYE